MKNVVLIFFSNLLVSDFQPQTVTTFNTPKNINSIFNFYYFNYDLLIILYARKKRNIFIIIMYNNKIDYCNI